MGFRFPLDAVLRVREIGEEREERLLGQILRQISHVRQSLSDLELFRKALIKQREMSLQKKISAAELHILHQKLCSIEQSQLKMNDELAKLDLVLSQQRHVYQIAKRSRESLSNIRESQLNSYRRWQNKQEQSIMDDNFNSRRNAR